MPIKPDAVNNRDSYVLKMKVVNIAYGMIKLQFKLPQTLICQGGVLPEGQYCMPLLFSKKGSIA